jgi:UPF0755 protein
VTDIQTDPPRTPRRPAAPHPSDDRDYEVIRPPGTTGRRVLVFVIGVALVMAIIAGGVMVWAMRQIDPGDPGPQIASLTIPRGSGVDDIGELLEARGVITSARVFGWYVRWEDAGANWKAGEYTTFHRHSSMADVVKVLDAGPLPPEASSVTLVPGTRLSQQLAAINKAFPQISVPALELTLASGKITSKYRPPGQTSWEGLLAADTFQFDKDATPQTILQTLVDHQESVMDDLGYDRAEALTGHSAWELITMASLAEREAGAPADEAGKIVRVIQNRLDRKIPLGIDASVLYGLGRTSGSLTKSDLATDTPYNNRLHTGLPPTPIATPSKHALEAAIHPPEGPWIYYVLVSNDPPTHLFTDSAREFQRAKDEAKSKGVF